MNRRTRISRAIVLAAGLFVAGCDSRTPQQKAYDDGITDALSACQNAVKALAQYKITQPPGYKQNTGFGDVFIFAWSKGNIYFENGFGADVPMEISCEGSIKQRRILSFVANGNEVIPAKSAGLKF